MSDSGFGPVSRHRFAGIAVLLVAISASAAVRAQSLDDTATFTFTEENDSFWTGVDRHYTQGARFAFASGETFDGARSRLADGLLLAPRPEESPSRYRYGLFFGQSIFTPTDTADRTPDPRDRPYAGWLYLGSTLYRESGNVLDRVEITIGIVGPDAQAEEVQNAWHGATRKLVRLYPVNGWNAQLHDEPGLVLSEERKWRIPGTVGSFEFDFLPEVNASVGNIFTYAAAGGVARLGRRLSVDWGPPRAQPGLPGSDFVNGKRLGGDGFAWYAFAGTEGRLVARNIFLDGNTFQDSASVSRKRFVADLTAGIAAIFRQGRVTLSYVRRSEEFSAQAGDDKFLSITLSLLL